MERFFLENQQKIIKQYLILEKENIDTYLIVGTMSSGKSTFLNSIIGLELFPSKNTACTAKTFTYYGNPEIDYFLYMNNKTKKPVVRKNLLIDQVEKWNSNQKIFEVSIEGPVNLNKKKSFAVIDTPGPNNSMDQNHEKVMKKALSNADYKKVIYLLNATQLGVDDDKRLLNIIKDQANLKDIIFVVNKADMIDDTEQENLQMVSKSVMKYLENNGFEMPTIYFVSAAAAMLATKTQSNIPLTRRESITYWRFEETMKRDLAEYNINVSGFPSEISGKSEDASIDNLVWKNSGIQSIINLL